MKSMNSVYRIGSFLPKGAKLRWVKPKSTLREIITLMLMHHYDQIPVITTAKKLKGVVTWKSIGSHLALGKVGGSVCEKTEKCKESITESSKDIPRCDVLDHLKASDLMHPAAEISKDCFFGEAIRPIIDNGYVLVKNKKGEIEGILTTSDFTEKYHGLAEPFFLAGRIEKEILKMLNRRKFYPKELRGKKKDKPPQQKPKKKRLEDYPWGKHIEYMEQAPIWDDLRLGLDRERFIEHFRKIKEIRDATMHFKSNSIGADDVESLRAFLRFLETWGVCREAPNTLQKYQHCQT